VFYSRVECGYLGVDGCFPATIGKEMGQYVAIKAHTSAWRPKGANCILEITQLGCLAVRIDLNFVFLCVFYALKGSLIQISF
jgi:hypothetical protein